MTAADRQRRYQTRQRTGSVPVRIDVPTSAIDVLVEVGLLGQWSEKERDAVAAALEEFLARLEAGEDGSITLVRGSADGVC